MYLSLFPQFLGINIGLPAAIDLAARHGFTGVDTTADELLKLAPEEYARVLDQFQSTGTRPGYFGLPPGRTPETAEVWNDAVQKTPAIAAAAQALGYTRTALVLLPFHETLEPEAALEEHVTRLRQILPILADHGISLGLEYVAAPSRRAPYPNHTIWNLAGTLDLMERVGAPNLGLMLDTFHWHGAGENRADLEKLRPEQVVVVHANDAPDVPLDQHTVMERALPGGTGVVNAADFFGALRTIGYDGPVTCEPMTPAVERLGLTEPEDVVAAVKRALDKVI